MAEGNPIKYSDLVIDDGAIDKLIKALEMLEKNFLSSQKKFRRTNQESKKISDKTCKGGTTIKSKINRFGFGAIEGKREIEN
jgi:hypothetical protein